MSVPVPEHNATSARKWWALGILALAQLVVVLDSTIVNVALTRAQAELGMSDSDRQWVINAYVLAFGALLMLGGRIADSWGRRRTFIVGLVGFGLTSAWGGLAQSGFELIASRGLQGAFAALFAPAALALLTTTFASGRARGTAFAVFGMVAGTGAAVGLALGGVLTEFTTWRWCLLVNIVFTIIGVIGAVLFLDESRVEDRGGFDVAGTITVTLGLGALVLGFSRAEHGWNSFDVITLLSAGVALLALFVWIESRSSTPILPLRILRNRVRAGAFLVQAAVGVVYIGMTVYLAFHLQNVLHFSPLAAGLASLVMTVGTVLMSPVAARLFARAGARVVLSVGPLITAASLVWLSFVTPDGSFWAQVMPPLLLLGVGMAFIVVPVQNVALTGIEPRDTGAASALVNSAMQIGGSIGLAVLTTLYVSVAEVPLSQGAAQQVALTAGHSAVFLATAVVMCAAALAAFVLMRGRGVQNDRGAADIAGAGEGADAGADAESEPRRVEAEPTGAHEDQASLDVSPDASPDPANTGTLNVV